VHSYINEKTKISFIVHHVVVVGAYISPSHRATLFGLFAFVDVLFADKKVR